MRVCVCSQAVLFTSLPLPPAVLVSLSVHMARDPALNCRTRTDKTAYKPTTDGRRHKNPVCAFKRGYGAVIFVTWCIYARQRRIVSGYVCMYYGGTVIPVMCCGNVHNVDGLFVCICVVFIAGNLKWKLYAGINI